jgi:hypothetical protein
MRRRTLALAYMLLLGASRQVAAQTDSTPHSPFQVSYLENRDVTVYLVQLFQPEDWAAEGIAIQLLAVHGGRSRVSDDPVRLGLAVQLRYPGAADSSQTDARLILDDEFAVSLSATRHSTFPDPKAPDANTIETFGYDLSLPVLNEFARSKSARFALSSRTMAFPPQARERLARLSRLIQ